MFEISLFICPTKIGLMYFIFNDLCCNFSMKRLPVTIFTERKPKVHSFINPSQLKCTPYFVFNQNWTLMFVTAIKLVDIHSSKINHLYSCHSRLHEFHADLLFKTREWLCFIFYHFPNLVLQKSTRLCIRT